MNANVVTHSEIVTLRFVNGATSGLGISADAFSAGELVGHNVSMGGEPEADEGTLALFTLTGALRQPEFSGVLQSVTVVDQSASGKALDIVLLDYAIDEEAAVEGEEPDLDGFFHNVLGRVRVAEADYAAVGSEGAVVACLNNIGLPVKGTGPDGLYALIVAQGALDMGVGDELVVKLGFLQD